MTITRRGFLAVLAGAALTTLSLEPAEPVSLADRAETAVWPDWSAIETEFDALVARTRARREYTVRLTAWLEEGGDGTWRVGPAR